MSSDSCNDYYQLCYNGDTSPAKDNDYTALLNGEFTYEHYISSPKSKHSRRLYTENEIINSDDSFCDTTPGSAIYSDLNSLKTLLQSSYLSEKLKTDNNRKKEKDYDKKFVQEAVSCLESLLSNGSDETHLSVDSENAFSFPDNALETCEKFPCELDNGDFDDSVFINSCSSTGMFDPCKKMLEVDCSDLNNPVSIQSEQISTTCNKISEVDYSDLNNPVSIQTEGVSTTCQINADANMCNGKYYPDEDSSSSGISSKSHSSSSSFSSNSPSSSSGVPTISDSNILNIEIDKLKNITIKYSPESRKRHSVPKVVNDMITDNGANLLDNKCKSMTSNTNSRSSTPNGPTGRKSPFFDLFKSKRSFDADSPTHIKQKTHKKQSKSLSCTSQSNTTFFCSFKKTPGFASKNTSMTYMEKQNSDDLLQDDDMKIQHASPFVRTIFQYIESTSVEDIFASSSFSLNDSNNVPVFTCGSMRNLQDNKYNSLSRKTKKNGIVRTLERGQHEPTLVSSGRRISENSDFFISIIAYLDRIRKAKNAACTASSAKQRRPKHRRHKSDPGDSISKFLAECNSNKGQLKSKHCTNSSEQITEVGLLSLVTTTDEEEKPWTLSKRFSDLQSNLGSKRFKSQLSNSDSAINHRLSLCLDIGDHRKSFSRKCRSLKNISSSHASKKKCHLKNESKRNSLDINRLSNYSVDSSEGKEYNDSKEIDQLLCNYRNPKKELFPGIQKNLVQRSSSHNVEGQTNSLPRRSVFSENFDSSWRESLSASSPSEIQYWLDTQDLSPDDRQILTDQLLLQLTEMGPTDNNSQSRKGLSGNHHPTETGSHHASVNNKECSSSLGEVILHSRELFGASTFHANYNVSDVSFNGELNDTCEDSNVSNEHRGCNETVDDTKKEYTNEKDIEKASKPKKFFGSMRKNKAKGPYWNNANYMNVAYDGDSIKRKAKGTATHEKPQSDNQKVKRFSAIRSIFEPITSPKSKKGRKTPIPEKFSCSNVPHNTIKNNLVPGTDCGMDNDGLKSEENNKLDSLVEKNSHDMEMPINISSPEESDGCHSFSINNISNCNFGNKMFPRYFENSTVSYSSYTRTFNSILLRRSKSTGSIIFTSRVSILCDRTASRSLDDVHMLVKHSSSVHSSVLQDRNDSGILNGSVDTSNPDVLGKDVLEVYIAGGLVKSNEDFEQDNVMEDFKEVTSSEPDLNWIHNKAGSCGSAGVDGCRNQYHVSNKDVENSRIIVDVPHHLIPPEIIASKSPIQSPNVRRKRLLKKTPCILHHSLSHEKGEKGSDFTSADSGLSLGEDVEYAQPQRYEKDVDFCIAKQTDDESVTVHSTVTPSGLSHSIHDHSGCKNSVYKTEPNHCSTANENKNLPQIIYFTDNSHFQHETIVCKNSNGYQSRENQCEVSPAQNYEYVSAGCRNTTENGLNTVKCQGQLHTGFSISNQRKLNNKVELEFKAPPSTVSVARVLPFNESELCQSIEDSTRCCEEEEHDEEYRTPSVNNSGEMHLTRKPSVIWAVVKKMEVSLVVQRGYGEPDVIKIEDFNVRRVNTYKDVEELAMDTFTKHLQLLDKQHLDLDTYDIKYLQMAEHCVPIGSMFDLSLVKIEDSFLPCRLCMKDKESWSLASLSYDSLIPKSYLEKYVSLILSHHHVIFFGPSGTGKSYLAERIANLINYRMNEGTIPPIILKNATPERWRTLLTNLCAEKREKPFIIIVDGFSQRFIESDIDIYDIVKMCEDKHPKPYIICTMTVTPNIEIPPKWQLNFRWIWLSNHEEPVDGLLQRYLRRKFIQCGNQHLQREYFRIADWLTSVWRHVNTFLKKFTSSDCSIGPTMFYECPTDILEAEEWFVDVWNYSITPYILHVVKQGLKMHGTRCKWEDPLTYILKSYPWVSEKVKKKMKLKRICMEDVDYSLHCHTEEEKQRLLDFLRQLEVMMSENKEADKYPTLKTYRMESSL